MSKVTRPRANAADGEHPRIFVALGTHGLYPDQNPKPMPAFSPIDASANSCGEYETLAAASAASAAKQADRDEDTPVLSQIYWKAPWL